MKYAPFPYQEHATEHIIEHPAAGLFLEMGLGKTVSTLTAIDRLMRQYMEVGRVLVIAPKRVAEDTWTTECAKWDHLRHLRISRVLGTEKQRLQALKASADIYVINRDNVVWLVAQLGGAWPFDMLVIDESSSFKSPKAARFKVLRSVRPKINRVVILTGTPAPNNIIDLWPQLYLLDQGKRLGKTITGFRTEYFSAGRRNGHVVYDYVLNGQKDDGIMGAGIMEKEIYDKIGDICISMKAADYLQLPERIDRFVQVRLPAKIMDQYQEFERRQVLALADNNEITAVNAAALSGKLLQFANGAVYDEEKMAHEFHTEKLEALEEIIESANGAPVLVFYWFKHDLQRLHRHLAAYKPQELKGSDDIRKWNEGKTRVLLAHPASAGHGLNLQAGGNIIVWFSLTWSLELYQQANARLHRLGQDNAVIVHHLVATGTMDEDVMVTLGDKADSQDALMRAVKARVKKYFGVAQKV
ncbi:SNF2-related protein [Chitinophaga rhizosphaerae]|uniref:SNF2-related protein n=1 Tax=Chitinophaga rhizosphaerae TaxID=1864947 RepID=UPI000F80C125|nr:SNF2-related protein [Chitinophaga rhizosphaerae]